jgi:superfamily II RNA helicase
MGTDHSIATICYGIRPIPLQYVVSKGLDGLAHTAGFINPEYKSKGRLGLLINHVDPTVRDIKSLKPDMDMPASRDAQYRVGQVVMGENTYTAKNETILGALPVQDTSIGNIYNIISYLFSNGMDPLMVFHNTPEATHRFGEKLVAHIAELERNDPEIIEIQRTIDRYHNEHYRHRDDKVNKKCAGSIKAEKAKNSFDKAPLAGTTDDFDITYLEKQLLKWRIPHDDINTDLSARQHAPQWVRDCLEYGIGVYVSDLPTWLKHHIFDSFNDGKLRLLLADSSISVGVNLPVRTCMLMGDDITHTLFKQAGGRAGRRGFDNQGYVLPMFDVDTIRSYISKEQDPVKLHVPARMTYSQLIRLTIPANLDRFSGKIDRYTRKLIVSKPFVDTREDIDSLKKCILKRYGSTLDGEELTRFTEQVEHINRHGYNYHRLTNLFKKLPEDNSILIFHLVLNGYVQKFTIREFVDMMSFLLFRVPDQNGTIPLIHSEQLTKSLQDLANKLNLDLDLSQPVNTYFSDFLMKGLLDHDKVAEIKAMGNWMYIFKEEVDVTAPTGDRIVELSRQVEYHYQNACTTKCLSEKKKARPTAPRPKIRI